MHDDRPPADDPAAGPPAAPPAGPPDAQPDFDALYDADIVAALDAWEPPEYLRDRPLPSRLNAWSRSSVLGAVMRGSILGLQEVLEPKRDDPIVIEVDADGEPHDLPIQLLLDPDSPEGSLCIVRRDPPPPQV